MILLSPDGRREEGKKRRARVFYLFSPFFFVLFLSFFQGRQEKIFPERSILIKVTKLFVFSLLQNSISISISIFHCHSLILYVSIVPLYYHVRLQIPLFSEQDNFLLKRGLRIIF